MIQFLKKSKKEPKKTKTEYKMVHLCDCGFKVPEWNFHKNKVCRPEGHNYIERSVCPECGNATANFKKKIIKEVVEW